MSRVHRFAVLEWVAACAAIVYVVLIVAMPVIEPAFDVLRAHPEDYAVGPLGALVSASYVAMAVALAAVIARLMPDSGWRGLTLAMLAPPLALCAALAVDPIGVAAQDMTAYAITGLAAGPLVVSVAFRRRFRAAAVWVVGFAIVVLVAFTGLVVAPEGISGIVNRGFDVAAGLWVLVVGVSGRATAASRSPQREARGRSGEAGRAA